MKTEREQQVGEEIAKCGSFKRAGSEEEMTNELLILNKKPKCAEVGFIVSETSEQPSNQKFVLGLEKKDLLPPKNCAAK